jgi:glycosyltransferase involved in cell wall biosynthesis
MRFLKRNRINLVHLNNSFNGDHDLILAAWLSGIPCIAHQRGVPGTTGRSEIWFGRRLTAIIAISNFIRADLLDRNLPEGRLHLIHDGIDPARLAVRHRPERLRRSLGVSPEQPVVGVVGNIKSWKGQHVFVEAIAEIAARHADVVGLVVGAPVDSAYQQRLHELARARGIDGRVVFVGYQKHPVDYMRVMDVVVHTSVEPEPFGIVIAEAMALERPVIATALGGPLDIVVDGVTGYLTRPGDPHELAERILQLLGDPALARRMGSAGRERFLERFTVSRNVEQIQALYQKCMAPDA